MMKEKEVTEMAMGKKPTFLEVLAELSPGKDLRKALEDILSGNTGALIVVDCPELRDVLEGGFAVNSEFTHQKLAELAKMDGAIILSSDLSEILFANTLLVPDRTIESKETGTRHKAAERAAKQADTLTIAVSERRHKISLFYQGKKYVLPDSEDLLRRATETLQILEKQREIFDDLITNLNVLEMTNLVSVGDLCSVLQRMEIITKILNNLKRSLIELGSEGAIIQMRIRELFRDLEGVRAAMLMDYSHQPEVLDKALTEMSFDGLLDAQLLANALFKSPQDTQISPRGYRILGKLNLDQGEIRSLTSEFNSLNAILTAEEDTLTRSLGDKTKSFKSDIENLKEQIMIGKKI